MKVLTSNAVTLWNEEVGEYVIYYRGHTFEDNDPMVAKLAPHHFNEAEQEAVVQEPQYYEDLHVPQLLQMCSERGLEPASNKKADLIAALVADDESE